jgi:hypothetical protein
LKMNNIRLPATAHLLIGPAGPAREERKQD